MATSPKIRQTTAAATASLKDAEVEEQLQRILMDSAFQSTPQLSALLSHIVSTTLAGRMSELKATPIAQAVFRRDESFDSQTDTIVRVEAGRLRRRLSQYYESNGLNDPILIEIPKGAYVPVFQRGMLETTLSPPADDPAQVPQHQEAGTAQGLRGHAGG